MCGIFGIINYGRMTFSKADAYRNAIRELLIASQLRGTDAAGLCVVTDDGTSVFKDRVKAELLIREPAYSRIVGGIHHSTNARTIIGHTRSQTKGDRKFNVNNHPIVAGNIIGVHNGMINNDDALFDRYKDKIQRAGQVDSEIIFRLIDYFIKEGKTIVEATKETAKLIYGSANCAFINTKNLKYVTLFSGYGVPVWIFGHVDTIVFASTEMILGKALTATGTIFLPQYRTAEFEVNGEVARIDTDTGKVFRTNINLGTSLYTGIRSIYGHHGVTSRCQRCELAGYGCGMDETYCRFFED